MKKRLYFILIVGMIFLSCEKDSDLEKSVFQLETPSQLTELEYNIYSIILNENIKNSDVAIYQKTSMVDKEMAGKLFQTDQLNVLEDSTIESYYNLNSVEYFLVVPHYRKTPLLTENEKPLPNFRLKKQCFTR